jgi:integrase
MTQRLADELERWRERTAFDADEDLVFAHPELGTALDRTKGDTKVPGCVQS